MVDEPRTHFEEHDEIQVLVDVPEFGVRAGMRGVIVHLPPERPVTGFEVEVFESDGSHVCVCALRPDQVQRTQG